MSFFSSLSNRIFMATAALAVLAIAVAVYRINVAVTAQAENELRRGLVEAGTLLDEHRTTLFEHFAREARLIADLPTLKAAVTTKPKANAGTKPRPQRLIVRTITYPPIMAKPPWAKFTNPMRPIVTERPTDTMNSTIPAAKPPSRMLMTSIPKITRQL